MKVGAHISAAGDLSLAPQRAKEVGCDCFQFFSRPPQGGRTKPLTERVVSDFKKNMDKYGQSEAYIHTPYYINLASADNRIFYGSISAIREELERGSQLGVRYVLTHLGSAKDLGTAKGIRQVVKGIKEVLKDYTGSTKLLIENSAGAGAIIGDTFEEIKKIVDSPSIRKYTLGICFDTAHAFASGYDLRDDKAVKKTFSDFNKLIGIDKLKLIHANDSAVELGTHKDMHAHIGKGLIGKKGFEAIAQVAKKNKVNLILETPHSLGDNKELIQDINILKKMR